MAVTEAELVAGVVAAPDDDEPRMVYADWLGDRGDPRGELIVAQCALERAEAGDRPIGERRPLRERVKALIAAHATQWLDPLFDVTAGYYELRRGLVEHVELMQDRVDAEPLRELAPVLRSVTTVGDRAPGMFAAASVLPIDEVKLVAIKDLPAIRRGCAAMPRLRRLELRAIATALDPEHLGFGGALERLALEVATPQPAQAVLERVVTQHERLRRLALRNLVVDDLAGLATLELEAVEFANVAIARWPALPRVTSLALSQATIGPIETILAALPGLTRLRIVKSRVGDRLALALAAAPQAARLRRLDLTETDLGRDGARALAASPHLAGLVELRLSGNTLDDATTEHVRAALPDADVIA